MITAVDTSVLIAIGNREPGYESWQRILGQAARDGEITICPVVLAELSATYRSLDLMMGDLACLSIRIDPFSKESCFLAGKTFRQYRARKGPRETMIPDFLIAAHARIQSDRLAAIDRGYLRKYFADLVLMTP